MSKPTQAARKRDFTKFNSVFARLNRDRYIAFDGRYEGPENSSTLKKVFGTDAAPALSPVYTNSPHTPLPDNQTTRKQMVEDRRRNNLFLWLSDRNHKPRKALNYATFAREDESCCVKYTQRTPFDELEKVLDPASFVEGGFQIKKTRRPEHEVPAWITDSKQLRLLARNLRYDKRGINMGFSVERSLYIAYLYYRCALSAGEIAGWINSKYELWRLTESPDISQEAIEGVIKRVKARGDRFFNTLQAYPAHPETIIGIPEDVISPEAFDKWVAEYIPELDDCQYIQ